MSTNKVLVTADELLRMPDDGFRYELVKGDLVRMTPAGGLHGLIAARLGGLLFEFAERNGLGIVCSSDTGYKIDKDPDTVRAPDASFVSKKRIPAEGVPEAFWSLSPDLAVEVASPGDTYREIQEKVREYLEAGTGLVWVVEPKSRTVAVHNTLRQVHVLTEADSLSGEDVLPGFVCPVREIFK